MASTDAIPVPRKNVAFRWTFALYKNDGTLITGAAGLDSEISKDGGTAADCTNEATEIATSTGMYYLDLTSTEMNADCVAIVVKTSSTGAVLPTIFLYPQETGDIKVDVTSYGGSAGAFSLGRPEVNTTHVAGTSQTGRDLGASVLLSSGSGTGQVTLTSGRVNADITHIAAAAVSASTAQLGVNVVNFGGSAGSFASGVPAVNATQISGDATAADNLENAFDDTAGAVPYFGIVDQGTAQSASSTGLVLRSAAAFADDTLIGCTLAVFGSTQGYWQSRVITDSALSGDTVTVDTWTVTPSGTITYKIYGTAPAFGSAPSAATVAAAVWDLATSGHTTSGTFGEQVKTDIDDILTDTGTTLDGRIPAALVSGRMDASVGAMANNVMTAAAAAADLTTELQSGLATASSLATVASYIDTEVAAILAAVDTEVGAIKTVTDALTSAAAAKLALFAAILDASTGQLDSGSFVDGTVATGADILEAMFIEDTGSTFADAVDGSVVKEIADNAAGSDFSTLLNAIKAKTDGLPSDPADASVLADLLATVTSALESISSSLTSETAAIKAKTDALPSDPADASVLAGLLAALEAKIDTIDSVIDAVKAKSDQLTFTLTGKVDARIVAVVGVDNLALNGTGNQAIGGA